MTKLPSDPPVLEVDSVIPSHPFSRTRTNTHTTKVNKSQVRLKDSGVLKVSELVELELDTLTVDTKLKVRIGVHMVSSSSNMEVAGTVVTTLNGSSRSGVVDE
jgi:hypothetical protein